MMGESDQLELDGETEPTRLVVGMSYEDMDDTHKVMYILRIKQAIECVLEDGFLPPFLKKVLSSKQLEICQDVIEYIEEEKE